MSIPITLKVWATARVFMELSFIKIMNKTVECLEDYSTYLKIARGEGQQPVLKRTMRSLVTVVNNYRTKICLTVIGYIRMRLNYQNSSYFGHDSAVLWVLLLHRSLSYSKVKIYFRGNSKTKALLIVFGTDNKRISLLIIIRVINAIGEVSCNLGSIVPKLAGDGRGPVVP